MIPRRLLALFTSMALTVVTATMVALPVRSPADGHDVLVAKGSSGNGGESDAGPFPHP
jgi:hypothetical protein